jgi:chromosome segregation protein
MKIKKIEICGFKSFSDRFEIEFPPGVTAIVGPNGCGKSNVVDAIRWALGEQSPRQLRGKAMEDVIFNGSEGRKPIGLAEVTLTFSNENGHALPDYLNFTEIAVNRKLFRSGESEYCINKVPCRLKDITDLFLGTGVGHRAYSVVEQGKMDFVLNAKPEERRVLIEEAAGVTKYKDRKAAAIRKMEATQQNLLRLSDVTGEIKRQMNSLNRQAKKAERYKSYREEMKIIELGQAGQTCRSLMAQQQEIKTSLQELADSEMKASTEMNELDASIERMKVNLLDLEQDMTTHQQRLMDNEGVMKNWETQIELAARELESLQKQILRAEEEIGKFRYQKEEAQREIQGHETTLKDIDQRIAADNGYLGEKEKILGERKRQQISAEERLAKEKNGFVDLVTRMAYLKNQILDLNRRMEENSYRQEKIQKEKEEAELKQEEIRALISYQSQQLESRQNTKNNIGEEREQKLAQSKELQISLHQVQESFQKLKDRLNQETSHLNSLLDLQKNFDGYQEGVRRILLQRQAKGSSPNGIHGLVEDIIETEPKYEPVVEAVLGERLQHLIVQDHQESLKAIDYLKTHRSGRSTFIPIGIKQNPNVSPTSGVAEKGIPLLDVVKVKKEYSHLAPYLFGDTLIVKDLPEAIELWNRNSIWKTLVTLDGEVMQPSGVVTGGSKEQIGSGTFHRKREIRDLTKSTEELRHQVISTENSQNQLLSSLKNLESSIEGLTQSLHQEELQIVRESKEIDQIQIELKRWAQKIETLEFEESQLIDEQKTIQENLQEDETSLQDTERIKADKEEKLNEWEKDLQTLKAQIEELQAEHTEAKVRLVTLQEKRQNLNENLERNRRIFQETETLLSQHEQEVQECQRSIAAAEEKRRNAQSELQQLFAQHQDYQAHLVGKKEALTLEREKLIQAEGNSKESREALQRLHEKKNEFSMKLMELDLNIQHLISNVEEKQRVGRDALLAMKDEQDYFSAEVSARQEELKSLIDSMGEVNLLAIQEYEESKTRLEFLTEQETDLVQSLEALNQAIKKINRTTRQRFSATFEAVNVKFKEIFATLFNGGRAELVLTDESNILETGVDIIAQPPGKKLQNVNLLSGGEKALTAVALIFSLFLINPSPFCLMDEVDAPLDDANIGRFNKMIKDLAEKFQIIVVTHNKHTMELANTLYGVTMEEPGISKFVSVRLN